MIKAMLSLPFVTAAFADGGASPSGIAVGNPTPTYLLFLLAAAFIGLGALLLRKGNRY